MTIFLIYLFVIYMYSSVKYVCVFCPFSVWMFVIRLTCGGQFVSSSCKSGLHWAAFSLAEMQRTRVSLFE